MKIPGIVISFIAFTLLMIIQNSPIIPPEKVAGLEFGLAMFFVGYLFGINK